MINIPPTLRKIAVVFVMLVAFIFILLFRSCHLNLQFLLVLYFYYFSADTTKNTKRVLLLLLIAVDTTGMWSCLLVGATHLSLSSKPVQHRAFFLFDMQSFFFR